MNRLARYIIIAVATAAVLLVVWYFQNIVAYVLVASVLSLIGKPLMDVLSRVHVGKVRLPRALAAAATLGSIWVVVLLIFFTLVPLIASQLEAFSRVDVSAILAQLRVPLAQLNEWAQRLSIGPDFSIETALYHEVQKLVSVSQLSNFFGSIAGTVKTLGVAAFATSFITFFFLKEEKLFSQAIILALPQRYEAQLKRALSSVHRLLVRYFIGLFSDMFCMGTLITVGLTFVAGFSWHQAMFIGLLAGVLNMIPYVGAFVGYVLGTVVCLVSAANTEVTLLPLLIKTYSVFLVAQVLDSSVLQPFIYSNSVKAHPLEIFLVILIAGSLGGILGMLIAIPTYTVLRVFAKEFFNQFRLVQKLTAKI